MTKPLIMPEKTAEQDPEAWAQFWRDYKNIRADVSPERRKQLNAKRYAKVKEARERAKLVDLMNKYPDEVQYTLHPDTRPGPAVRRTVDPRDYYTPSS